jgi:VanZ family protein
MTKTFWTHRAPAIAWALLLFALSSIPDLSSPIHLTKWQDKIDHFIAYAIFGALVLRALSVNRPAASNREFALTLTAAILYGATDELHQYFVPGRYMDYKDLTADAVGVFVGAVFYMWLSRRRSRKAA